MSAFVWELDQQNLVTFVMIDGSGGEVSGLSGSLSIEISKNGGAFASAAGAQAEISNGWYSYLATAGEGFAGLMMLNSACRSASELPPIQAWNAPGSVIGRMSRP